MSTTYLRLEILRLLRNPRTLIFTVIMPVVLFLIFANIGGGGQLAGISSSAYTMVSMAAYGSIGAAMFSAAAIALERKIGWQRQLRLTPLPPVAYVAAKAIAAWLVTLPALALVYAAGYLDGVRMPVTHWAAALGASWAALIPFVLLGIGIGLLGKVETTQPVTMFCFFGLSIFGGLWVPVEVMPKVMGDVAQALPSYWLGLAGRAAVGAPGFGWDGVAVLAAWTLVFALFAARRYRADAKRA